VSREADRWFVSFTVEEEVPDPRPPDGPAVGVDLGVSHMATLSDGRVIENPNPLRSRLRKIRRLSRELHRRAKGSNNRRKTVERLAKAYWRIGNIRRDALHKATTHLAKNHGEVIIEDLNVRGMTQNRRLARAVSDVGMAGFRKQLEYKCRWYGSRLTVAPRFYPSTKRCSSCGHVKDEMPLSARTYECERCGLIFDRDLNAALNLVAVSSTETLNACGDLASTVPFGAPRAGAEKQEVNAAVPHGSVGKFHGTASSGFPPLKVGRSERSTRPRRRSRRTTASAPGTRPALRSSALRMRIPYELPHLRTRPLIMTSLGGTYNQSVIRI